MKTAEQQEAAEALSGTPRERPLAARKSLIKSASVKNVSEAAEQGDKQGEAAATSSRGDNKTSDGDDDKAKDEATDSPTGPTTFTPPLVRKVEAEIAQNTAKFDESVKSDSSKSLSSKKLGKNSTKTVVLPPPPLQAFQVLRMVRVVVIILVAAYTSEPITQ